MISFGYAYDPSCFCGFQTETLEYLFFSCPLAQSGIAWIQSILFQASPLAPTIEARHLLVGFSTDEFRCVPRVFAYLLNVCKYFIWVQRNDFRFRANPPGALGLLACIKSRVRFYLPSFTNVSFLPAVTVSLVDSGVRTVQSAMFQMGFLLLLFNVFTLMCLPLLPAWSPLLVVLCVRSCLFGLHGRLYWLCCVHLIACFYCMVHKVLLVPFWTLNFANGF